MENHYFNGKTHYKWPCSIAFCMFTSVTRLFLMAHVFHGTTADFMRRVDDLWSHEDGRFLCGKIIQQVVGNCQLRHV